MHLTPHAPGTPRATRNLADLRLGDQLTAVGTTTYRIPRIVKTALGPISPGSPVHGVVFEPTPAEIQSGYVFVLYPNEARGLTITYQRPAALTVGE